MLSPMSHQHRLKANLAELRLATHSLEEALALRKEDRIRLEIKYELAAARFELALIAHAYLHGKAGFRRDQPRWPQGTPGDPKPGGRWSGGAGTEPKSNEPSMNPKGGGHHPVPGEVYRNEPLQEETRNVFRRHTTGPIRGERHGNSIEHMDYNEAVQEAFDHFKTENGISRSEDMTPEQAKEFVDSIKQSSDPRIRNFNMKILMRQLKFYIRRGGRGGE